MRKKYTFILLLALLAAWLPSSSRAATSQPVYKWISANECYFILPVPQDIYFPGNKETSQVHPWGLGFRAVGNGERFSKTGGLQIQNVRVSNRSLPETSSFYIFDLLLGLEYMTPKVENKPFRFTASALGDFGLAGIDLFMAPVISAGFLYTMEDSDTPTGLTFSLFYRPTEIDISDVGGGKSGRLQPGLGFKIGYIFEGFWTTKEK
jgi:hypothetical protein